MDKLFYTLIINWASTRKQVDSSTFSGIFFFLFLAEASKVRDQGCKLFNSLVIYLDINSKKFVRKLIIYWARQSRVIWLSWVWLFEFKDFASLFTNVLRAFLSTCLLINVSATSLWTGSRAFLSTCLQLLCGRAQEASHRT